MFNQRAGVKIMNVPYKGAAPAIRDLLGGQVDIAFVDSAAALSNLQAGKLRVLDKATPERLALLLNVPPVDEEGVKDFPHAVWTGVVWLGGLAHAICPTL